MAFSEQKRNVFICVYSNRGAVKGRLGCFRNIINELTERVTGSYYVHMFLGYIEKGKLESGEEMWCYEVVMGNKVQKTRKSGKCYDVKMSVSLNQGDYDKLLIYLKNEIGKPFNMQAYLWNFLMPFLIIFTIIILIIVLLAVGVAFAVLKNFYAFIPIVILLFILVCILMTSRMDRWICSIRGHGVFCAQLIMEAFLHIGMIDMSKTVRTKGYINTVWQCLVPEGDLDYKLPKKIRVPRPYEIPVHVLWDVIWEQLNGTIMSEDLNINSYAKVGLLSRRNGGEDMI